MKIKLKWLFSVLLLCLCVILILLVYIIHSNYKKKEVVDIKEYEIPNYETMSIKAFRSDIIGKIEEKGEERFAKYLEDMSNPEDSIYTLYDMDDNMYYLQNVLVPTISDKWENWQFNGACVIDNVTIEYSIMYNILDAENITMGKRNDCIKYIVERMQDICRIKPTSDNFIKELRNLEKEVSDSSFKVNIDGIIRNEDYDSAVKKNVIYLKSEYDKVLTMMIDGYKKKKVGDFLKNYVSAIEDNSFQKALDVVYDDIRKCELPETITKEQEDFLTITLETTIREFIGKYQDGSGISKIQVRIENINDEFDCLIDYIISYNIDNVLSIEVGERDNLIRNMRKSIENIIKVKTKEELYQKNEIEELIKRVITDNSSENIKFDIEILSYRIDCVK